MSIFKTRVDDPAPTRKEFTSGISNPMHPAVNDSVTVVMAPSDQVQLFKDNYPHYDGLSVSNLPARRRGKNI